jgi:serine/threonine protein kinase
VTAWGSVVEFLGDDLDDIEFVGRGSSGSVYRAMQRSLGRTVAVKVFRRFTGDETDRVIAEAKAQAALSWHANIVSLYSQGVTPDGFPYLVMEYAPGGSLEDRVRDTGPLDETDWRRVGVELAAALRAAHEAGVVHCDVKPSNVLFAADGSVRLADFGIAKAAGMTSGTLDSIEGSLGYVAPELLDGERPRAANDIYSMVLTLAFAQSGEPPFPADLTLAQAVAAVQAGSPNVAVDSHCNDPVAAALLERSYAKDPAVRPTAGQIAEALGSGDGSSTPGDRSPRVPDRPRRLWLALAVVTLLGMVGLLLARSPEELERVSASSEPEFDLCDEYETYVRDREDLITNVSAELEQSASPVDVVDRLLNKYPLAFAELARPFLDHVLATDFVDGDVTVDQLATVVAAESLRVLDGGKPFLYDGENGAFDPAALPPYLHEPARVFSEANEYAVAECPNVSTDFTPRKARLNSAIYSNLSNPHFMEGFFENPASYDVFDARTSLLIATYAWDFFEGLLSSRTDWFFETLERHEDVRRVLASQRPEALLKAVALDPALADTLRRPEWVVDVQEGLDLSSPATRRGISNTYGPQLEALGLVVQ